MKRVVSLMCLLTVQLSIVAGGGSSCGRVDVSLEEAARCNARALQILLEHGADPNARFYRNETPLYVAAHAGNLEAVRLLVSHGARVNTATVVGSTPLHAVVDTAHQSSLLHNRLKIIRLLVAAGADPNAQNNGGQTPLHRACKNEAIRKCLLDAGARDLIIDVRGHRPSDLRIINRRKLHHGVRPRTLPAARRGHVPRTLATERARADDRLGHSLMVSLPKRRSDPNEPLPTEAKRARLEEQAGLYLLAKVAMEALAKGCSRQAGS